MRPLIEMDRAALEAELIMWRTGVLSITATLGDGRVLVREAVDTETRPVPPAMRAMLDSAAMGGEPVFLHAGGRTIIDDEA